MALNPANPRGPYRKRPVDERFWKHVERTAECFLWLAALDKHGYGVFNDGARVVRAHRFAYEQAYGPVPDGLVLDHLCRTPACVRPEHLEAVTQQVNVQRAVRHGPVPKATCGKGHAMVGDNVYRNPTSGKRACRACISEWSRRTYLKRKERAKA